MSLDLEALKEIFKDKRSHIAIASIIKISLASDRSHLKCLVKVFPEQREMVATMTWESVGPSSGIFHFPAPNDMVIIAFADGDENQCFVIKRLTSKVDKIPLQAVGGDTAMVAVAGKKIWITSDQKIYLSKGTGAPAEPLVLGTQLQTLLAAILEKLAELSTEASNHTHIGNLGYPTDVPMQQSAFTGLGEFFTGKKSDPVDNGGILSDLAFTEKGS